MKGLLLKEWYLLKRHCILQLVCFLFFILAGAFVGDSVGSYQFFPCMYAAIFPITLLSYDEYHKWDKYSRIFPYTAAKIVSVKYLVGLCLQFFALSVMSLVHIIQAVAEGQFSVVETLAFVGINLLIASIFLGINLPVNFRFGTAKGRIVYYVVLGVGVASCVAAAKIFEELFDPDLAYIQSVGAPILWLLPVLAAIGIYAVSWLLSVSFYKKRYSSP